MADSGWAGRITIDIRDEAAAHEPDTVVRILYEIADDIQADRIASKRWDEEWSGHVHVLASTDSYIFGGGPQYNLATWRWQQQPGTGRKALRKMFGPTGP